MKRMLPIGFLLFALLWLTPSSPVKADTAESIIGTWIVTATVNTPPGAPPLVLAELASFNPGGTFIDTISIAHSSQNPFFSGPFAPLAVDFSDALGTWKQVGDSNQFALTFKRLLFAGANTPPTVYGFNLFPGQHVGLATIQGVVTVQQDTAMGQFTFQLTNLAGQEVLRASGMVSATRLKIEPLATP
jgi:hypothetical protein